MEKTKNETNAGVQVSKTAAHRSLYIVDFVTFEKKLVIELDGGQHAMGREKDEERDLWLKKEGYEVLRFWDNEVFENLDGVLEVIKSKLLSPSPNPSHKGRGIH
jgi:very-short-patch-repair endonuclease